VTTGIVQKVIAEQGTEFGARADRRLREELIGWLVTVRPDGLPVPVPVWFLWDGETIVVYSQPGTPKLRNIAANPKVALHLDGNGRGGDIVVISAEARVDQSIPLVDRAPAYLAKYAAMIRADWASPAAFAGDYSVPIRLTPRAIRGH